MNLLAKANALTNSICHSFIVTHLILCDFRDTMPHSLVPKHRIICWKSASVNITLGQNIETEPKKKMEN